MENTCFTEIPLEPSPFKPDDGGADRGVGWLQKYGVSRREDVADTATASHLN